MLVEYDVVIIGGGLSGLTAASLLAKRKLRVAVVEKSYNPGGSCGVFKRGDVTFDQGSAMLYGFGETGFNSHRFVFNALEEEIDVIQHDLLYCVNYDGHRIKFYLDVDKFVEELSEVFPNEKDGIKRFYKDMGKLYHDVMVENPTYTTADETDLHAALESIKKHPISYLKFLGMLNRSAKKLLERYFKNPEIFNFFDKMTSTYCYSTVEEAPAILASVMFIDNHVGGSYYPAGSTLFLPGKLEKVIEENGGDMFLDSEAVSILFENEKPVGVLLKDGTTIKGKDIVYSGTVWNLYENLIDSKYTSKKTRTWAKNQEPTYPSVVLYSVVDKEVIPEGTAPIEMLVGSPDRLDEKEVTAYIFSIDDRTICPEDVHVVMAIGPSFANWDFDQVLDYRERKKQEEKRLIAVLEDRFPGFSKAVRYAELATPKTLERYNMKHGGAVAGPKQMIGQHMFKRMKTRSQWDNLFCCGESTVMGTGTPTVTVSGISAANAILSKLGKETFLYKENMKNYVRYLDKPVTKDMLYGGYTQTEKDIMHKALKCRMCEYPTCTKVSDLDVRGIMRRVAVGNYKGAYKAWLKTPMDDKSLIEFESSCILAREGKEPVPIKEIVNFLKEGLDEKGI